VQENPIWKAASTAELDNAIEGIEKTIMNKLYEQTFAPRATDDTNQDDIISKKMQLFRWVEALHFDIKLSASCEPLLKTAQDGSPTSAALGVNCSPLSLPFSGIELLKLNKYKAPRDKVICILNCCKVIFSILKKIGGERGADAFLPLLIFVVIKANPPKLYSNCQYIQRFRNENKLRAEAGYYFTNLVSFFFLVSSSSFSHRDRGK